VYITGWDSKIYSLDKETGEVKWSYNTHATLGGPAKGIQSSVTLTPEGRVLAADSNGQLFCLDAKKGTLIWHADAAAQDPTAAHAWASPTVANGRVFMGIASHNDAPCTRGVLIAYSLDTGLELWRQHTVPERVCYDDTANECSANGDCAAPGSPCLIGNCDSNPETACAVNADCPSTFLTPGQCDAATGAIEWVYRTESIEQFKSFPGGPTYHDYGFLNGPILVDNGTPLAVAGSKDGAMYAINQDTGLLEWASVVSPPAPFAGFGL